LARDGALCGYSPPGDTGWSTARRAEASRLTCARYRRRSGHGTRTHLDMSRDRSDSGRFATGCVQVGANWEAPSHRHQGRHAPDLPDSGSGLSGVPCPLCPQRGRLAVSGAIADDPATSIPTAIARIARKAAFTCPFGVGASPRPGIPCTPRRGRSQSR
jgi:hypothetical protein